MIPVLLAMLSIPQGPTAPVAKAVFEVLPVQHLCSRRAGATPPVWGTLLTCANPDDGGVHPDLLGCREPDAAIESGDLHTLLTSMHVAQCENGELRIAIRDGSLTLFGEPSLVAQVRSEFRALAAAATAPVLVEATVWDIGQSPPPPAVLTAQEYARFQTERRRIWQSAGSTSGPAPIVLGQQRWTRYVRDTNVEVAQKAMIPAPVTDAFCEGGAVAVRPHALVGTDDLVLHVQFGFAEKRALPAKLPTGIPGHPQIDVPTIESMFAACSGRVQNGGALAITLTGLPNGGGQRVVTIRATQGPAPALPGNMAALPIGAFVSAALTRPMSFPAAHPILGDPQQLTFEQGDQGECYGCMPSSTLVELIHDSLGEAAESDFRIHELGGLLFVFADKAKIDVITNLLRGLQDRLLRTVTIQHVGMASAIESAPASPQPVHSLTAPTLLGRSVSLARLVETTVVRDLFVEIAQESIGTDPIVDTMQVGTWLAACVVPNDQDMFLQMRLQCALGDAPPPHRIDPAGVLTLLSISYVETGHHGLVAAQRRIAHGDGPLLHIDSRPCRSELVTSVTW